MAKDQLDIGWQKALFFLIAAPIAVATIYLAITTVYLNLVSETGGPVHWHADYEIWTCGVQYELLDPTGLDNKIGSPTLHEHNDNRIHVEGVLFKKNDARLGNFFKEIGGKFNGSELILPTKESLRTWKNDDRCDGKIAQWQMFVNGKKNEQLDDYVISPWTQVPPGDCVILEFDVKKESTDKDCISYRIAKTRGERIGS